MKKTDSFSDRRQEAEAAKARRLNKFKSQGALDCVDAQRRAAARQAQTAAQAARNDALTLKRAEKAERQKAAAEAAEVIRQAEQKTADLALAAQDQQLTLSAEAAAAQAVIDEAGRKAKRDARYARRKATR